MKTKITDLYEDQYEEYNLKDRLKTKMKSHYNDIGDVERQENPLSSDLKNFIIEETAKIMMNYTKLNNMIFENPQNNQFYTLGSTKAGIEFNVLNNESNLRLNILEKEYNKLRDNSNLFSISEIMDIKENIDGIEEELQELNFKFDNIERIIKLPYDDMMNKVDESLDVIDNIKSIWKKLDNSNLLNLKGSGYEGGYIYKVGYYIPDEYV